jgi:hypothetical protein
MSNNKNRKSSGVKPVVAGIGVCLVIGLMALAGCDDGNVACNCPDKIHGNAPCGCGGIDCTCKQRYYTLNCGIVLEDTTGQITSSHIELTNEAFDDIDADVMNTLINKGLRIKVISGNSHSMSNNEVSVGIDNFANRGVLGYALNDHLVNLLTCINNFNSNIHLTKWNLTPQKRIMRDLSWQHGNDAKRIVRYYALDKYSQRVGLG